MAGALQTWLSRLEHARLETMLSYARRLREGASPFVM